MRQISVAFRGYTFYINLKECDAVIVYVDVLIGLNLYINYFLFLAVSKIMRYPIGNYRNLLASAVLSLASLVILLPPMGTGLHILVRLVTAVIGVLLGYGYPGIRGFLKLVIALFTVGFLFAGVMTAWFYLGEPAHLLVQNGSVYYHLSPVLLVVTTLFSYLVVTFLQKGMNKSASLPQLIQLHLQQGEATCSVQAKLDTGFFLCDLYGDRPVVLVSPSVANRLFSPEHLAFRLIPYETVGEIGLLQSGVCKKVVARYGKERACFKNVVIAVAKRELQEEWNALVGTDFMERMEWDDRTTERKMQTTVEDVNRRSHRLHRRVNRFTASFGQRKRKGTDGTAAARGLIGTRNSHHP